MSGGRKPRDAFAMVWSGPVDATKPGVEKGSDSFLFDGFCLDPGALELRQSGAVVDIPPLALDLLVYLVLNRDRVVSKDELFNTLWAGSAVSENALAQGVWAARRAVCDTGGAQRVIKNVRGRGYRFVAQLEEPAGEGARTVASASQAWPRRESDVAQCKPGGLIGRAPELSRLRRYLQELRRGRGQIGIVSGAPGTGKSMLLQEIAREAQASSISVLWGYCHDDAGTPPFWPWQQAARRLLETLPDPGAVVFVGGLAPQLCKLIPELEECIPRLPATTDQPLETQRFQLFDAVCQLFVRAARTGPVVIVLEDLHWADEASLRLLDFAAAVLPRAPVLLLASLRDLNLRPALGGALNTVLKRSDAELMELEGLDASGVAALLSSIAPNVPSAQLVDRVTALTGGDPFFVSQLAGLIASAGGALDPSELPKEAVAVVRRRLAQLPEELTQVLRQASILGSDFHVSDLRRTGGSTTPRLLELLEQAARMRIVQPIGRGAYRFAHPTIHKTVYGDLPPGERAALHRRAAEALAEAYVEDPRARVDEIALHYFEAALDGDLARAIEFGSLAALSAFEATAYEESAAHYRRTLLLVERQVSDDPLQRGRLHLKLGDALHGSNAPLEAVRTQYAQAAELGMRTGNSDLLVDAATRYAGRGALRFKVHREAGTVDDTEIRLLEQALSAVGDDDSPRRAVVCAWLAYSLYNTAQDERRAALSAEAIEVARRLGDPRVLAEALLTRQYSVRGPSTLRDRIEMQSELIGVARGCGARGLLLDAHHSRAWARLEAADLEAAAADIDTSVRLANEVGESKPYDRGGAWARMQDAAAGRLDKIERWLGEQDDSLEGGRANQSRAIQNFMLLLLRDRIAELLPGLEAYAQRFPLPVAWHAALICCYAAVGRTQDAQTELHRLRPGNFACVPDDHNWLSSCSFLANASLVLRDRHSAEALYGNLLPYADRLIVIGLGGPMAGSVERPLGELAWVLGEHGQAIGHFERAVAVNDGAQAPVWTAWTELDWAQMLFELEGPHSREAHTLLDKARAFGEAHGISLFAHRAARLQAQWATGGA